VRIASKRAAALCPTIIVACSGAAESTSGEHGTPDRVVLDASEKTRETVGVSSWGIANGSDSTVVHGYDAANAALVVFEFRAGRAGATTFEATLDAGGNHATLRIEAPDPTHVRVLEDSFEGSPAAESVLSRMVSDLKSQPVRPPDGDGQSLTHSASLRILNDSPDGLLISNPTALVDRCGAILAPAAADAGEAVIDCSGDPNSGPCQEGVRNAAASQSQAPQCCEGQNPASIAHRPEVFGHDTSQLQHDQTLPLDAGVSSYESCANFVSAVLQKSGLINWHSNEVGDLMDRLEKQGWREVPASEARPGDVAIIDAKTPTEHADLVYSSDGHNIMLIGSNNTGVKGTGPQQIGWQSPYGKVIYLAPPGCR
jgi:hypothetical protein